MATLISKPLGCRAGRAPEVEHGAGVAPVLGRGDLPGGEEGGVGLEPELGHELGARVDARVQAVPPVVVVMPVAPARVRSVNPPPAQQWGGHCLRRRVRDQMRPACNLATSYDRLSHVL